MIIFVSELIFGPISILSLSSVLSPKTNFYSESFGLKFILNQSEIFRIIPEFVYPTQTISFLSNPKKFFNTNQIEAHSKSIRTNPVNPNETEFSESFGLSRIDRIHSD